MATNEKWTLEDELEVMAETRAKLAAIEREWQMLRETSRATTLRLVTEHGISVAKASRLSGHHRNTITTWLIVWNAEQKSARKKN